MILASFIWYCTRYTYKTKTFFSCNTLSTPNFENGNDLFVVNFAHYGFHSIYCIVCIIGGDGIQLLSTFLASLFRAIRLIFIWFWIHDEN